MPPLIDETGNTHGRLTVRCRSDKRDKFGRVLWVADCSCGNTIHADGYQMRTGRTKSCGCLRRELHTTHGESRTRRRQMYYRAKYRAKQNGIEFSIDWSDMPEIPEECPILGTPLAEGSKREYGDSPSLDRRDGRLGYVPENLSIVSHRANRLKDDATLEDTLSVAAYQMGCPGHLAGWANYEQTISDLV